MTRFSRCITLTLSIYASIAVGQQCPGKLSIFSIASSADDASVTQTDFFHCPQETTSITSSSTSHIEAADRAAVGKGCTVRTFGLSWNTLLPIDAVVDFAWVEPFVYDVRSDDNQALTAAWRPWPPAMDPADYSAVAGTDALRAYPLASIVPNAWNRIPLDNANGVNLNGPTSLMFWISGEVTAGVNKLDIFSFDSDPSHAAHIGICFHLPVPPLPPTDPTWQSKMEQVGSKLTVTGYSSEDRKLQITIDGFR